MEQLFLFSFFRSFQKGSNIDCELNSISGRSGSEIILAGLKSSFPSVEVHGRHLSWVGRLEVQVQRLRLADEGASCLRQVYQSLLGNLPDCLVDLPKSLRNSLDVFERAIVSNEGVLDLTGPESVLNEVLNKMRVDADELSGKDSSYVDVRSVGLKGLVVSKNLRGGGSGHGSDEERVSDSVLHDFLSQLFPVVPVALRSHVPKVELELALRQRRPLESLISSFDLS